MDTLFFFLVVLALGSANSIGPTTIFGPSLDDRIKTAIDRNVQWLLSGIRNGSFEGPDLPRAVVALFLAEPGFFNPGHKIGQELKVKIETALTELIGQRQIQADRTPRFLFSGRNTAPSFIPSVELALYVQALLVSCVDPYNFIGYDLTDELYQSVIRHHCDRVKCTFPSPAMLALCNARAASIDNVNKFWVDEIDDYGGFSAALTDEEAFFKVTVGCLESSNYPYPRDIPLDIRLRHPLYSSEYRHNPSNPKIEYIQELTKLRADGDPFGNTTSVFAIAAAMQNEMFKHRLHVYQYNIPLEVHFLLKSQDEDGSWGQSTLNSFFVLPVLSNKSFLDITSDHCPESRENESLEDIKKVVITILNQKSWWYFYLPRSATFYNALTKRSESNNVKYRNGTDGKPYLHSLEDEENNPETGYFWFTYEQTRWPKESFTLLTQSHADIRFKPSSRYLLWHRKKREEDTQNDQNELDADFQVES